MDQNIKTILRNSSLFLILFYVTGFIVWNMYLSKFSFFEYDLLQTRFISAGFTCLLVPIIAFLDLNLRDLFLKQRFPLQLIAYFFWILIYSFLFPSIPQALGGSQPFAVSLIGSEEQILFLNQLNLESAQGSKVQTLPVCEIYSNNSTIIVGISTFETHKIDNDAIYIGTSTSQRKVVFSKDIIMGKQPLKSSDQYNGISPDHFCRGFI
jgi:hypothetical protein